MSNPLTGPSPPRNRRWLSALVGCAVAAAFAVTAAPSPAQAEDRELLLVPFSPFGGVAQALLAPESSPPGANDWSCHPTAAHPNPVVLVNGTFAVMADNWNSLSPLLFNHGYCVFAFNYGGTAGSPVQSVDDIVQSAYQLAAFVDRVRTATGVSEVDLVGHSQGGMMPRYYLRYLGGAAKVNRLVALAPSNHGTTLDGLVTLVDAFGLLGISNSLLSPVCTACVQQEVSSAFLTDLNAGGDTVAGVTYTVIETAYDAVITPFRSALLSGTSVTNIVLQEHCLLDFVGHVGIAFDPVALTHVLNALDPAHRVPVPCLYIPPGL
jgi:triacylglycerol esterase/lipase EstA (alpha/beta hydrolase family)